jgi:cytochrome P450
VSADSFDLLSPEFKRDPYPTYERMRAAGELVRVRMPILGDVWMATTYAACEEVIRDHGRFVQDSARCGRPFLGDRWWIPRMLRTLATSMVRRDEPDHRRLRSLVDTAFQRRSIAGMRPRIESLAAHYAWRCRERLRAEGQFDLQTEFARPFPLAVISELLGLPEEDRDRFLQWGSGLAIGTAWDAVLAVYRVRQLFRYLKRVIREYQSSPRPGLLAELVQAEVDGERLSETELLAMSFLLLVAGHETTVHLISTGVLTLLDHPGELVRLRADWSLAPSAVDECLRYVSSVMTTKPRYVFQDQDFRGVALRRGDIVLPLVASANCDPAEFPDPLTFDISRHPNRHLTFGAGIHYCLGAQLARLEASVAFETLWTEFPDLRLAVPRDAICWKKSFGTRVLKGLPVTN